MDFNKLKDMGMSYFQKGKELAVDAAAKGKNELQILQQKNKLNNAQSQLGALVYRLAKGQEENQDLVEKYIDAIAEIEEELARLQAVDVTADKTADVEVQPEEPVSEPDFVADVAEEKSVEEPVQEVVTEVSPVTDVVEQATDAPEEEKVD